MPRLIFLIFFVFAFNNIISAQKYYGGLEGQKLDWLFSYLKENYVDSLNHSNLADMAIRRVVQELDPFSTYQSKAEADAQLNRDNGVTPRSAGFSFYMVKGGKPIITYVNKQGPAEKAGLEKGNELIGVNSKLLKGLTKYEIESIINDTSYNEIKIDYLSNTLAQESTVLIKDYMPWFSVVSQYMINDKIGYIKIESFTKNTVSEFNEALEQLKEKGLKDLIIDLRNNAGGVKTQAIEMVDQFLPGNKLINYSEGLNLKREDFYSTPEGSFINGKVICLSDKYTASASEIFLSTLQEWDRAFVIGTPSYGKGLIQQSYKLGDGSTIRLTIGRYYSPTGRHVQNPKGDNWFEENKALVPEDGLLSNGSFDDEAFMKTKGNRKVVKGNGGVYPDLYFVASPVNTIALDKYNKTGDIYRFTTNFIHQNRTALTQKYSDVESFRNDNQILVDLTKAFKTYLVKNRLAEQGDFGVARNIVELSKTWIAAQVWGDSAYYEVQNSTDQTIQKAIEVMNSDLFQSIGIK